MLVLSIHYRWFKIIRVFLVLGFILHTKLNKGFVNLNNGVGA